MNEQQNLRKLFVSSFLRAVVIEKSKDFIKKDIDKSIINKMRDDLGIVPLESASKNNQEFSSMRLNLENDNEEIVGGILSPQVKEISELNNGKSAIQDLFSNRESIKKSLPQKQAGQTGLSSLGFKPELKQIPRMPVKMMGRMQMPPQMRRKPFPGPAPAVPEKINVIGLAKLDKLLSDSAVQTIECPGPSKQILVYKSGMIQTTSISFTTDEITNIMNELSEKTRIPLGMGVFKAAFGDFVITSVISEFVGTRFIIQRKIQMPVPADYS